VKSYSPFRTVSELLANRAATEPERTAVTFEGQRVTYRELDERAAAVQTWLQGRGVAVGDKVAILAVNSLEFLYAWFGIARAGAVGVPVNTSAIGEALRHNLEHSDAVGLVVDAALLPNVRQLDPIDAITWTVVIGEPVDGCVAMDDLLASSPSEQPVWVDPSDAMNIIYTSGTTGLPKGVVLSHTSYLNTGAFFADYFSWTADDVLHTCLPLFHCNAQQTTIIGGLHALAPVALNGKFSLSNFFRWIEESRATVTNLLGAMVTLIAKLPEKPDDADNTLRLMIAGPTPEALYRPLEKRFGMQIVEGFGLTETGTSCCLSPVDATIPGTVGLPLPYTDLRIVDENDEDVPDETPGEILTRSHIPFAFMTEYYKEPQKTAEAMKGGWFHTGDQGKRRTDGYFVFLDRMKDTIRRRGENISSFLIEKVVGEHPDIQEVVAIGVPSELGEEDVKIVCIRQPGATITAPELSAWCEPRLGDFMRPRYIEFREAFPRTETGRVQKLQVRAEGIGDSWDRDAGVRR
jgi:crotonobetaine/carnitine-CoA ligase